MKGALISYFTVGVAMAVVHVIIIELIAGIADGLIECYGEDSDVDMFRQIKTHPIVYSALLIMVIVAWPFFIYTNARTGIERFRGR